MFDNIGGKIKGLAYVTSVLGIIVSIAASIVLLCANSYYNPTITTAIVVLIGGCVGSWVGGFFTYGFGELIEQQTTIACHLSANGSSSTGESVLISTWECPSCKHTNRMSRAYCEECGYNK